MKVYNFRINIGYAGGCIVAAGNSKAEARAIISKKLPCYDDGYIDNGRLVRGLSWYGSEPKVLIDETYIEWL